MKQKTTISLAIISLAVILICATWAFPGAMSLYYQKSGAHLLDLAQPAEYGEPAQGSDSFTGIACDLTPPSNPTALSNLDQARLDLLKAIDFNSHASQGYLLLGETYCRLGKAENAINALKTFTHLRPNNPLGHLALGFAYQAVGKAPEAINEWHMADLSTKDFMEARNQALQYRQYQHAAAWLEGATLFSGSKPDILSDAPGSQPLILEGFITSDLWQPCSWCQNTDGSFKARNGVLEIAYNNIPDQRSGFAIVSEPGIPIDQFHELTLRVKGKPGTILTIEIVQDGVRSRPINYMKIPEGWGIWTVPINGTVLNQILLDIGSPEPIPNAEEYQVSVDWIGLR